MESDEKIFQNGRKDMIDGNIKDDFKIWIWRYVAICIAISIIIDIGRGMISEEVII